MQTSEPSEPSSKSVSLYSRDKLNSKYFSLDSVCQRKIDALREKEMKKLQELAKN